MNAEKQNRQGLHNKGKNWGKPFAKGVSGNPTGRPKDINGFRERAREKTGEALDVLEKAMKATNKPAMWNMRIKAARTLIEFGWGKPVESISHSFDSTDKTASIFTLHLTDTAGLAVAEEDDGASPT
jgi:hypothetical protein